MRRLDDMLVLAHLRIVDVNTSDKKVFGAEIINFVEYESEMGPREALMAVHDLKSRAQYDRACIDQAADAARDILENGAPESGVDLAAEIRERMYKRFHIDDDGREATFGTDDHKDELPDFDDLIPPETDEDRREASGLGSPRRGGGGRARARHRAPDLRGAGRRRHRARGGAARRALPTSNGL